MWRISLKNLLANKARLALTSMAVVLGVSFVVASFVLSDGLSQSFGSLSSEIVAGTDLVVRDGGEFGDAAVIDDSTLKAVSNVEGVRVAEGAIADTGVQPIRADGTLVSSSGPPILAISWTTDPALSQFTIVEGIAPDSGQFVLDEDAAERVGFAIGETYAMVSSTGRYQYELVGITRFGEDNTTNGATLMGFTKADTAVLLGRSAGTFDQIEIAIEGGYVGNDVMPLIQEAVGAGFEVVNQQTLEEETASEFNEAISILRNVLLGFAGVSLFVSTFIIYNTFGIVLAQRVRELGLLRAIGAESKQIRRSIIGEAFIVGAVASVIGLAGGVALNSGLRALFGALGAELPSSDLILAPRTIGLALLIGVGVTVVSSLAPAARAARVSPIAAMTEGAGSEDSGGKKRMAIGAALLAVGVTAGAFGLQGNDSTELLITALAIGAIGVFVGVAMLSPLVARPIVNIVGWPFGKVLGVSGMLARKNAGRHPRRTATTAAALMIGLALVTTALVVGDSIKSQISKSLETTSSADYVISTGEFQPIPDSIGAEISALPEIGTTLVVAESAVKVGSEVLSYNAAGFDELAALFDLSVSDGSIRDIGTPALVLPTDEAAEMGAVIGDEIPLLFDSGESETFELIATYDDQSIIDGGFIDLRTAMLMDPEIEYFWVATTVADGVAISDAEAAMASVGDRFPQVEIRSDAEYRASIESEIDGLLNIINALLALAIFIALLGIGLTLALSVVERTRELGLLRAVGLTRRQMRRMVRWEAAAIAMFGAVLGVAVGLVFGWASVTAFPDTFITTVSVPVMRLVVLVGISGVAGLAAALLPARRAGRLNVLEAIAQG